jgi:hypothetical protein
MYPPHWKADLGLLPSLGSPLAHGKGRDFSQETVDLTPCPGSNTATAFTDARKDMKNG